MIGERSSAGRCELVVTSYGASFTLVSEQHRRRGEVGPFRLGGRLDARVMGRLLGSEREAEGVVG